MNEPYIFLKFSKKPVLRAMSTIAWGYPFNWETRRGTMWQATPLITTVPYVYEAFREVYRIDEEPRVAGDHAFDRASTPWRTMGIQNLRRTLLPLRYNPGPEDSSGVINASAYRAFLLTAAAIDFSRGKLPEDR